MVSNTEFMSRSLPLALNHLAQVTSAKLIYLHSNQEAVREAAFQNTLPRFKAAFRCKSHSYFWHCKVTMKWLLPSFFSLPSSEESLSSPPLPWVNFILFYEIEFIYCFILKMFIILFTTFISYLSLQSTQRWCTWSSSSWFNLHNNPVSSTEWLSFMVE